MTWTQRVGLVLGPLLALLIALPAPPDGLSVEGQRGLAVLALCVCWWMSTPVALPVTSLVGLALLPILGVLPPSEAFALFGNQAVFFVIGVFLIASAMLGTGLSKRMALWAMRRMARSEDWLAGAVLILSTLMCLAVVSHAVAAIMLPIVIGVISALDLPTRSRTARRLLLSMAWGTILGSNLTLFSSARASLAMSTYSRWAEGHGPVGGVAFFEFSAATVGVVVSLVAVAYVWLRVMLPPEGLEMGPAIAKLDQQVAEEGPISGREWRTLGILAVMVPALVVFGPRYGLGTVALLFSGALFAFRVLDWEEAERSVNWGIVLLYGGAIAIGAGLDQSGAMAWIVAQAIPTGGVHPWLALAGIAGIAMVLTEFVSNAAVIAIALPAVLAVAPAVGLDGRAVSILMSVATGLAFSMPTSTPAMAMVYGTGYVNLRTGVAVGVPLSLFALPVLLVVVIFIWPILGFSAGGP
ncbi:MAG: anion permease [Alphaproteobacteria bacterium]|nr:anion permease [Alphaproteobacteria bacterium]